MRALIMFTAAFSLVIALAAPAAAAPCQFMLGFKMLHDLIPATVGGCLVDEHHNPTNGDGLQETTGVAGGAGSGLLVWRKADNWTAYTDGYHTWINGPLGLQQRLNTGPLFPWEAPGSPPASTPSGTPKTPPTTGAGFGGGAKVVGTDVAPGTYRSLNIGSGCYWKRLSGFGGTLADISANDNPVGPTIVTIASSDKGFDSNGCGQWTPLAGAITSNPTASFGDGAYVVGTDVTPGTWKANESSKCYWQRDSGFNGTLTDIIANGGLTSGPSVVQIAPSDVGFTSAGCGSWTKIG